MSNNIVPLDESSKTQRPSNSAFKQQKLSAWQPILTVGTVLPTFFLIGVTFIPVGIGLLISSYQVQEYEVDYTRCERFDPTNNQSGTVLCSEFIQKNPHQSCECRINIEIPVDYKRDVYIYYGLTNFYQNHRRYVKSRDDYQLLGHMQASSACVPFAHRKDENGIEKTIMPCGAIANSLFNDTFKLIRLINTTNESNKQLSTSNFLRDVPLVYTGIAWATDKRSKFINPPVPKGSSLASAFNGTIKPVNWRHPIYELDKIHQENNGLQNEGLMVWMRAAAFPTFRKLLARVAHDMHDDEKIDYQESLPKGNYQLRIDYNFPVAHFKGRKRFIISNTSWLGGRNSFIGAIYVLVGIIALILSAVFFIIHKKFSKNSDENLNLTPQTSFLNG